MLDCRLVKLCVPMPDGLGSTPTMYFEGEFLGMGHFCVWNVGIWPTGLWAFGHVCPGSFALSDLWFPFGTGALLAIGTLGAFYDCGPLAEQLACGYWLSLFVA